METLRMDDMLLKCIRVVFTNETNDVCVYNDISKGFDALYTIVSIRDRNVAKVIAGRVAANKLFNGLVDFIGYFNQNNQLHLVFNYRNESSLSKREPVLAGESFEKRKEIAFNLIYALYETGINGETGKLLLQDVNLNLLPDGSVYLNYFFNFHGVDLMNEDEKISNLEFTTKAAMVAFEILSRKYAEKFSKTDKEGNKTFEYEKYPQELFFMYKRIEKNNFTSLNNIMNFIKTHLDELTEKRLGVFRVAMKMGAAVYDYIKINHTNFVVGAVVMFTVIYVVFFEMIPRFNAGRQGSENTYYSGMSNIGDVYLGEELD